MIRSIAIIFLFGAGCGSAPGESKSKEPPDVLEEIGRGRCPKLNSSAPAEWQRAVAELLLFDREKLIGALEEGVGHCEGLLRFRMEQLAAALKIVKDGGLTAGLLCSKETYAEFEPLDLVIVVRNSGRDPVTVETLSYGIRMARKVDAEPLQGWGTFRANIELRADQVQLVPFKSEPYAPEQGRWSISFKISAEGWEAETPSISIDVAPQPVETPSGTDRQVSALLHQMHDHPPRGGASMRPGGTWIPHDKTMDEIGKIGPKSVPALIANLGNFKIQKGIVQLLGDMKVREAVPHLLAILRDEDEFTASLIVEALGDITGQRDHFHRRWFDPEVRRQAREAYRKWWEDEK